MKCLPHLFFPFLRLHKIHPVIKIYYVHTKIFCAKFTLFLSIVIRWRWVESNSLFKHTSFSYKIGRPRNRSAWLQVFVRIWIDYRQIPVVFTNSSSPGITITKLRKNTRLNFLATKEITVALFLFADKQHEFSQLNPK